MRDAGRLAGMALSLIAIAAVGSTACGSGEPRTDAERLSRGREIVERMSAKLGSTPAFSVTTSEIRDEIRSGGATERVALTRETTIRRPDRLYSKISGDRHNEIWYDGVGLTLALHNEKVFGQGRAPETLDKTLDAIHERYGVRAPLADYVHSAPAKALLAETTTGGWVGRETAEGRSTDHLAFKDKGVNWEVWISADGDPLPQKAVNEFTDDKRLRKVEMSLRDWNLAPQIAADRFSPSVPPDYEGIAILQRARIMRSMAEDGQSPAATGGKK
jgi:hypothetical protein